MSSTANRPAAMTLTDPDEQNESDERRPGDPPDPRPLLSNLALGVVEVLGGARDLEQVSAWVTDHVYRLLLREVVLRTRVRRARNLPVMRPAVAVGSVLTCEPRSGVVEASVVVLGRRRSRAVAIRLESTDSRWRATSIRVL
jgi:hypothetical protein